MTWSSKQEKKYTDKKIKISCCNLQTKKGHLFLQFEIFMKFKRLRRKHDKNKAMLTFAFKKSLKTTLPSQDQDFWLFVYLTSHPHNVCVQSVSKKFLIEFRSLFDRSAPGQIIILGYFTPSWQHVHRRQNMQCILYLDTLNRKKKSCYYLETIVNEEYKIDQSLQMLKEYLLLSEKRLWVLLIYVTSVRTVTEN